MKIPAQMKILKVIILALFPIFYSLSPAVALAAKLSLSPSTGTFNPGCNLTLNVILDTQGASTDGVDAILLYDSTRFSAKKINNGTIYSEYPGNIIEPQAGRVIISGSASAASPYSGNGILATVDLSVLPAAPAGATQIKFDYDAADRTKTTDSNVAERNNVTDILTSVTDGSYVIGTGTACVTGGQGTAGTVASGSANTAVNTSLPKAADFNTTLVVTATGIALTVLGILGLAFL